MSALCIMRKMGTAQVLNKGESMEACAKVDETWKDICKSEVKSSGGDWQEQSGVALDVVVKMFS